MSNGIEGPDRPRGRVRDQDPATTEQVSVRLLKSTIQDAQEIAQARFEKFRREFPNRVAVLREAISYGLREMKKRMAKGDYRPLE